VIKEIFKWFFIGALLFYGGIREVFALGAELKLNSNDGSTKFAVQDSATEEVFGVDSDGNVIIKGTVTVAGESFSIAGGTFVIKSGNVGIGTTSPGSKLTIAGGVAQFLGTSTPSSGVGVEIGYQEASTQGEITVYDRNLSECKWLVFNALGYTFGTSGTSALCMTNNGICIGYGTPGTAKLAINGNVGIGTTSPTHKLHVSGGMLATSSITANGGFYGDGSNLTGITASNADTLDGLDSVDFAQLASTQTFTGQNTFANQVTISSHATISGNVGIGALSPGSKLEIKGLTSDNSASGLNITDSGGNSLLYVRNDGQIGIGTKVLYGTSLTIKGADADNPGLSIGNTAGDRRAWLGDTGTSNYGTLYLYTSAGGICTKITGDGASYLLGSNLGIGTTSPGYRLQVGEGTNYGWVAVDGSWGTDSDRRVKTNIEQLDNPLDIVQAIRGVRFNKISDAEGAPKQVGFIAQEVEKVLPEVVSTDDEGNKGLSYAKITPVLLEAIKEQQKLIKAQNLRISELEVKMSAMENKK